MERGVRRAAINIQMFFFFQKKIQKIQNSVWRDPDVCLHHVAAPQNTDKKSFLGRET